MTVVTLWRWDKWKCKNVKRVEPNGTRPIGSSKYMWGHWCHLSKFNCCKSYINSVSKLCKLSVLLSVSKITVETPEVCSEERKPGWTLFENKSASSSIKQYQSASTSTSQQQHQSALININLHQTATSSINEHHSQSASISMREREKIYFSQVFT